MWPHLGGSRLDDAFVDGRSKLGGTCSRGNPQAFREIDVRPDKNKLVTDKDPPKVNADQPAVRVDMISSEVLVAGGFETVLPKPAYLPPVGD